MSPKPLSTRVRESVATAAPRHPRTMAVGAAALAALALMAAGCGASGSKQAVSSASQPSPPAAQAPAATAAPIVIETASARYGEILTTAQGFALYTYTADRPGGPGCTGTCLQFWPPLLLPAGTAHPTSGPGVTGLGTVARGSQVQVTYRGLPLYTYISDKQPGQTTGQDVVESGYTWLLATVSPMTPPAAAPTTAAPVTSPPATMAPTTMAPVTSPPVTPVTSPRVTAPMVTPAPPVPMTTPPPKAPKTTPSTTAPPGLPSY